MSRGMQGGAQRPPRGARSIAQEILLRAEAAGQYADRALDAALSREKGLGAQDKALVTTLFYGVIEHRITLDYIIDGLSSLAPSSIERGVRMTLRVALYQLLYLDRIPDHAAVGEAVELTPRRSKGFVNALLRAFCRQGKAVAYPDRACAPFDYLSVRYSVPTDTAEAFCRIFGLDRAEALLAAFEKHPPITVRTNTLKLSREELLSRVPGATPTKNAPFGVVLPSDAPLHTLISEGLCFVQDEASQLAVAALERCFVGCVVRMEFLVFCTPEDAEVKAEHVERCHCRYTGHNPTDNGTVVHACRKDFVL